MLYRPVASDDMSAAALVRRVALFTALPGLADVHTLEEDEGYWRDHLASSHHIVGAYDKDRLVGVIAYGNGWVEQLYVLPQYHRQGIGSRLMDFAFSELGKGDISLWTFQRNTTARAFYEKLGFVATRHTDGSDNEEQEPDVLYVRPAA